MAYQQHLVALEKQAVAEKGKRYPSAIANSGHVPADANCVVWLTPLYEHRCFYQCSQCVEGMVVAGAYRYMLRALCKMQGPVVFGCPVCRLDWGWEPPILYRSPPPPCPASSANSRHQADPLPAAEAEDDVIFLKWLPAEEVAPVPPPRGGRRGVPPTNLITSRLMAPVVVQAPGEARRLRRSSWCPC